MQRCPHCQAQLESPLGCGACGRLLDPPEELSPFALLGLPEGFAVDEALLKKRLLRAGRLVHPDYFAAAPAAEHALAERNTARLNRAHGILADPIERADWLLGSLGGPDENQQRAMPGTFLAEVLEWNETLEQARSDPAAAASLEGLGRELALRRTRGLAALGELLEPLPGRGSPRLSEVRTQLNALRYVDRALGEIEALELARASRR